MFDAESEMQLVGRQFGLRRTVTVKKLVTVLPQLSEAITVIGVTVLVGKQVPEGGEYWSGNTLLQQVSMAVAENVTGTQLLQVSMTMFVHTMERHWLPGKGP
jgi:hypothetical protein